MDFVLTIDTEWDRHRTKDGEVTVENLTALPLFHALCVSEGIRPCYLVAQEAADAPIFVSLGERVAAEDEGEIGTHLHPMTSPPYWVDPVVERQKIPFPTEYPLEVFEAKLGHLRKTLERRFGAQQTYRAGRFGLSEAHVPVLLRQGFRVDTSVTPRVSWAHASGLSENAGPDWTAFDARPFWWEMDGARSGRLLELPVTIVERRTGVLDRLRRVRERSRPQVRAVQGDEMWLRPMPGRMGELVRVVRAARCDGLAVVNLMMHSNELHPGCNPYFDTAEKVEELLGGLRSFFRYLRRHGVRSVTPREIADRLAGDADRTLATQRVGDSCEGRQHTTLAAEGART